MTPSPELADSSPKNTLPADNAGRFPVAVALTFWLVCYAASLRHAMWRDEWQPLVTARDTDGYAGFLKGIEWWGMNGFFSFCWLIQQAGLGIWFFKLVLVSIAAIGIYVFCRYSPFSRLQNTLFAFGYFPLYEYGTILRNYGIIMTTAIACTAVITSSSMNPLLFGISLAAMAQTNAFGLAFALAFGGTYLYELHRRNHMAVSFFMRPETVAGIAIATVSIAATAFSLVSCAFMAPEWVAAAGTGGNVRHDAHLNRFLESLVFPIRGLLPVPLFGTWNSQILDPWPWAQVAGSLAAVALIFATLLHSRTGFIFFGLGLVGLGGLFTQVPWNQMRYHGHYFVIAVLALWIASRLVAPVFPSANNSRGRRFLPAGPVLTFLLTVHAAVGAMFILQEQIVPFSGSQAAAEIIREKEPADVLVIGDVDAWMTPLSGCLNRPVYIASRRELGSYLKVDQKRRWSPLAPDELLEVIKDRLAAEQRDVVLVTNYPLSMPKEFGMPIGVVDRSITDERYFIFRIRYRRPVE